jgi:hypothetical protein
MRDKQVREAKAALKIEHQVENLRLHGHTRSVYGPRLLASIGGLPVLAELAAARA